MELVIAFTIIIIPCFVVAIETITGVRTRSREYIFAHKTHKKYQILVPIWGNIKYLENVEYLSKYSSQVTLCTTGDESAEFYKNLSSITKKHNFGVFIDKPKIRFNEEVETSSSQRTTSGAMRDTIIRNALKNISDPYVVTLDADSTTSTNMAFLIGELEHRNLDIASIRVIPRNNQTSVLAKLQNFEYELAMKFRFISPWLISGACHVAKTEVLRDIMNRHSLFFQGNDVETGVLARTLNYKVGHIPFNVLTTVPDTIKAWFRQRLAWSGGEFRLFIVNFKFIFKYPVFWIYGSIITISLFPMRIIAFLNPGLLIYAMLVLYAALIFHLHWKKLNPWVILMPFYTLFITLFMTPLGIIWYFYMAYKDNNYGVINIKNKVYPA